MTNAREMITAAVDEAQERNDMRDRIVMSFKIKEVIDEALKGFFKIKTQWIRGTPYHTGEAEGLNKALIFLKKYGIEGINLRDSNKVTAPLLEVFRSDMKGKICVDAPDWFGRCDIIHEPPPTILYVPEKLALKIFALGFLPLSKELT
jgi:hypothetical protein